MKNRKLIYTSWVESQIRYGLEIYGNASDTALLKLQKVQNKVLKILFQGKLAKKTDTIMQEQHILNIKSLRDYMIMVKNYFVLQNKFMRLKSRSNLRLKALKLPLWRNNYGKMRASFFQTEIFNRLNAECEGLNKISEIKKN